MFVHHSPLFVDFDLMTFLLSEDDDCFVWILSSSVANKQMNGWRIWRSDFSWFPSSLWWWRRRWWQRRRWRLLRRRRWYLQSQLHVIRTSSYSFVGSCRLFVLFVIIIPSVCRHRQCCLLLWWLVGLAWLYVSLSRCGIKEMNRSLYQEFITK